MISAKIASEDPVNEPHPVSADFGEIPTVEPEENEEEIETDSIATTVQVIISIFEINRIIFINILFDKNILMNTDNYYFSAKPEGPSR